MTFRVLIPVFLSTAAFAQDPIDRLAGIWKPVEGLNAPNWTSVVWTITKTGPYSAHSREDIILKSGEKQLTEASVVCDGKPHGEEVRSSPFLVAPTKGGTATCDPKTLSFRSENKGQTRDSQATFSTDGKTLTYRRKLVSADGKQTEDTVVYAKQ